MIDQIVEPGMRAPDIPLAGPYTMTILPTYRCTAACAECCFESSPHVPGRIPLERILRYIDDAVNAFPLLRLVCFSGGECFLLQRDLDAAVAHAHRLGLRTRCVTNGYWAINERAATERLSSLRAAGLDELNISTGDEHQQFVPFERVVDAAIASARLNITTLIVVEGCREAAFTARVAVENERLRAFAATDAAANLKILTNVWMPFHANRSVTHDPERLPEARGCDNVLTNVVITPHEQLAACCGLTMEHIPEMKLGDLRSATMGSLYDSQYSDFMKLWLWLDGPHAIYRFALSKDPSLQTAALDNHHCYACAIVHQHPRVRRLLAEHYTEAMVDVLHRYYLRRLAVSGSTELERLAQERQIQFGG